MWVHVWGNVCKVCVEGVCVGVCGCVCWGVCEGCVEGVCVGECDMGRTGSLAQILLKRLTETIVWKEGVWQVIDLWKD